ncbi:hypothetical protein Sa4125_12420 [Aureimonas sp. SA4125]|uniref:DUF2163 domain-containing protein n=1 Tax=Aureimonas sp. SA4125 TaxID=2826993 RepID=UPI001CC42081|nr:DUF2163 domain-containing protein [Aureimonas sp. SA4125]BDA83700.1 hypothetical protein Sa4125_12420 [Aureimonas sp. SA4125]
MRTVPDALGDHLAGQATTLATGWRLTRRDGTVLGFTDHDEVLVFAGTIFEAAAGLTAGEAEASLGLAAGTQEVEGALSSLAIEAADIAAGRYDGARVEIFVVNWQEPDQHFLLDVAELGEVTRGGPAFTAELRGIASRLDRRRGRIYRRRCDAVLGDARCGVDTSALHADAALVEFIGGRLIVTGVGSIDLSLYAQGHVVWQSGEMAGLRAEIAGLRRDGDGRVRIGLLGADREGAVAGDLLRLHAGCDKSFATCRARFDNGPNFRGFPHLPGNDAALGFARKDALNDGAPVVP